MSDQYPNNHSGIPGPRFRGDDNNKGSIIETKAA
jgi:hypothetical protein